MEETRIAVNTDRDYVRQNSFTKLKKAFLVK